MSKSIIIPGKIREGRGKSAARKLRTKGWIPGNIIGTEKTSSVCIELEAKDLSKAWQAGRQFELDLDGTKKLVKIQELQLNAAKRQALHVDLMYL